VGKRRCAVGQGDHQPDDRFLRAGRAVRLPLGNHADGAGCSGSLQAGRSRSDRSGAFVPHQANLRIINIIAEKLGIPSDRVARDIVESGNTSAATIPLALSKMVERGEVPSGSPVLLLGFGSGLSFAGQVVIAP
jgi:3-oxoacyl-[acyl-carrier-protein] synthase-3